MMHERGIQRPPNEDVTNYRWFVVRVFTGRERMVAELLGRHGFWPFWPYKHVFRWRNKYDRAKREKHPREVPMLPGYILLGWPAWHVPWHLIMGTPRVISIVGRDGVPHELTEATVRNRLVPLMADHQRGAWDAPDVQKYMASRLEFGAGDEVEVVSGSLEGRRFVVSDLIGRDALVWQSLFGRNSRIKIPVEDLAPVR